VVEVGWEDDRRFSIALIEKDLPSYQLEFPDKTSVFLVTGGSGGIIARWSLIWPKLRRHLLPGRSRAFT